MLPTTYEYKNLNYKDNLEITEMSLVNNKDGKEPFIEAKIRNDNDHKDNIFKKFFHKLYDSFYKLYIHFTFIVSFEILFYFLYIVKIEKNNIEKLLHTFSIYLYNMLFNIFDTKLNTFVNQYSEHSKNIKENCNTILKEYDFKKNDKLYLESLNVIYFLNINLFILSLLHFIIYRSYYKIILKFLQIIFLLLFIGLFEYWFFTNVIIKYKIISNDSAGCDLFLNFLNENNKHN